MSDLGEIHNGLGKLEGMMMGLTSQVTASQDEFRGGLASAHKRMDGLEETHTTRLNSHADDIKELRSDMDHAKGGVMWGKVIIPLVWAVVIGFTGGIGWLLANSPAFTNTGIPIN